MGWGGMVWDGAGWERMECVGMVWDGMGWGEMGWNGMMRLDGIVW